MDNKLTITERPNWIDIGGILVPKPDARIDHYEIDETREKVVVTIEFVVGRFCFEGTDPDWEEVAK